MLRKSDEFFYQNGEIGADRYGEALTAIDLSRLDIFGEDYISQHIFQYIKNYSEIRSYRYYVTSCLQAIAENTTHFLTSKGMEDYGKTMTKSWAEIIDPPEKTKEEIELENVDCVEFTEKLFKKIRGKGDKK